MGISVCKESSKTSFPKLMISKEGMVILALNRTKECIEGVLLEDPTGVFGVRHGDNWDATEFADYPHEIKIRNVVTGGGD